jgi:hypothetical protein
MRVVEDQPGRLINYEWMEGKDTYSASTISRIACSGQTSLL